MTLGERLLQNLKDATKGGDIRRVGTLRMLFASLKNKEIEERKKEVGLGEEEIISVIQKEAKKRRDAASEYTKANRPDLADHEREELVILEEYLPKELSDEEITRILNDGIRELGSPTKKDFGALMKIVMPLLKGKAGGERISLLAGKLLGDEH